MPGIFWSEGEARLVTYSTAGRAGRGTVIKIEIEVTDTFGLASILRSLEGDLAAQQEAERQEFSARHTGPNGRADMRPASSSRGRLTAEERRAIARGHAPLLIGYREK